MKLIRSFLVFRKISALLALSLCLFAFNTSLGQSALGSIYGDVKSGSKVTVINEDTGLTREASSDLNGRFNVGSLPPGNYTVSATKPDGSPSKQVVRVNPGVGTVLSLSEPISLEEVIVSGRLSTQIDTTTSQVSTTYSAEQLAILPVAQDITNVALLAPGTVKGDSEFGNLASFGGSSVAENSYYINGFNVTNLFKNLAYSSVPFYAIESEQVLTGGYGPEYGLSTGGVVNLVTKKGTNSWESGLAFNYEPNSQRSHNPTTYNANGSPYRRYSDNSFSSKKYTAWAGGPLAQDKVFIYAIGEFEEEEQTNYPRTYKVNANVTERSGRLPYGLVSLDFNINSNHLLNITAFNDSERNTTLQYGTDETSGWVEPADFLGTDKDNSGGTAIIGKYDGELTDNLSLSLQYGELTNKRESYQIAPNGTINSYNGIVGDFNQPGCPYVTYAIEYTGPTPSCYVSSYISTRNGEDNRHTTRIDLSYQLTNSTIGHHGFKFGYEKDNWNTFFGESLSGGAYYDYLDDTTVDVYREQTGANLGVQTNAFYLKDDWQVTNKLLLQLGLRSDSFHNLNGDGISYLKQDNILQPRIGFALDLAGDATSKLYGSFGVYSLPVAATVALRSASASLYSYQQFNFSGVDPVTGKPTLIDPPITPLEYLNHEDGTTPNPASVASKTLDPTIQNEFILGYQFQFNSDWSLGTRLTYRDLKRTIDDICDLRPFEAWATANSLVFDDTNLPGCFMINPGDGLVVDADVDGDNVLEHVSLSAADLGLPKAIRRYVGIELTAEKALSSKWATQLSYTWSHNYGNAEGLVKSDIGQDDTGVTQDFDFPELMIGTYGDLPNDRRHTFKGNALYKPNDQLTFSVSGLIQSGRPKICFGTDPVTDAQFKYFNSYMRCGGTVIPRGSLGTTPWVKNFDLGVYYEPCSIPGLSLQAKWFNVLEGDTATNLRPYGETRSGNTDISFNTPISYQTPKYVQLTAVYKFGSKK